MQMKNKSTNKKTMIIAACVAVAVLLCCGALAWWGAQAWLGTDDHLYTFSPEFADELKEKYKTVMPEDSLFVKGERHTWLRGSTCKALFEIPLIVDTSDDFDIDGYVAKTFPEYKKTDRPFNSTDDYDDMVGKADCYYERGSVSGYDYSSLACSYANGKLMLRFYGDDTR